MKKSIRYHLAVGMFLIAAGLFGAVPSEISVRLKMDRGIYITGERIRAVVDISNMSGDTLNYNMTNVYGEVVMRDAIRLELFRASDKHAYDVISDRPFVAPFQLRTGEGLKLETFFGDHFSMVDETRYLARIVLIHGKIRYESALKGFDVLPGMRAGGALQLFSNAPDMRREFELAHYGRDHMEHLFLKVRDTGREPKRWDTVDLGPYMSVTAPRISVKPTGEVVVLHRSSQDAFLRTEFWSLPTAFEYQSRERLTDPEVAGIERAKDVYREAKDAKAAREKAKKKKSWWTWGRETEDDDDEESGDEEEK